MFVNALLAEWTKLRSTRSFYWTTGLILGLSIGWTALSASLVNPNVPETMFYTADQALVGFNLFGLVVIMIQAIMVVTTEYRYGLPSINYAAIPQRWVIFVAKFVLYAVIAALLTFISVAGSLLLAQVMLPEAINFQPFESETATRALWALPLLMVVLVLFVQGLGLLIRQTAGTVAIALVWYLGLEATIMLLPVIGEDAVKGMPLQNMNAFMYDMPVMGTDWSPWLSLGIFGAWAAVAWVAGVLLAERRDA